MVRNAFLKYLTSNADAVRPTSRYITLEGTVPLLRCAIQHSKSLYGKVFERWFELDELMAVRASYMEVV